MPKPPKFPKFPNLPITPKIPLWRVRANPTLAAIKASRRYVDFSRIEESNFGKSLADYADYAEAIRMESIRMASA